MVNFKNIHIFIKNILNLNNKQNISEIKKIFNNIVDFFYQKHNLSFDASCTPVFSISHKKHFKNKIYPIQTSIIPKNCNLIIVIGGDGTILNCIRKTIDKKTPFLGIHQGRLGFLADLSINNIETNLIKILSGDFIIEHRSILLAKIKKPNKNSSQHLAVNDIVLCNNKIPKLIEFEIFINNNFILRQRADGLIISTPTGSTAYSLSAGGPILDPTLKNLILVPLYPHTLNSRPIVIDEKSIITLKILKSKDNTSTCSLNFDGQENIYIEPEDQVIITRYPISAKLIHPKNYNYFLTLREKLGWNNN